MIFNWENYLTLSNHMMEKVTAFPDEEACCRTIVSRAYYAAYCLVRNQIKRLSGTSYEHSALQRYLIEESNNELKRKIGNQLKQLHQDRKNADYDDELRERPSNKAKKALTRAVKIVNEIEQIS